MALLKSWTGGEVARSRGVRTLPAIRPITKLNWDHEPRYTIGGKLAWRYSSFGT